MGRTRVCKKELPWGYVIVAMGSGPMAVYSAKSPENGKSPESP